MKDANTEFLEKHEISEEKAEIKQEKRSKRVSDLVNEMMRNPEEWRQALIEVLSGKESDDVLDLLVNGLSVIAMNKLHQLAAGELQRQAEEIEE